ncbi:MAG TPA: KR domain-containing protein, partial [Burkholderiaceae bacterium]|nr:KR domain-containing protein [Burkholderiaceae bacterium]
YLASVPAALQHGAFIGSAGEGHIASAARIDYAAAAAVVLTRAVPAAAATGLVLELAGDGSYTLAELAAELSRRTGRTIPYVNLPQADFAAALKCAGLPAGLADLLADSDVGAAQGGLFDDSRTLSALIGRPTEPIAEGLARALDGAGFIASA